MKEISKIILSLLVCFILFSCNKTNNDGNDDTNVDNNVSDENNTFNEELDYSTIGGLKLFEDVKEISISFTSILNFTNASAKVTNLDAFIDKISSINSSFKTEENESTREPGAGGPFSDKIPGYIGIHTGVLTISYNNFRKDIKLIEFIGADDSVYPNGCGREATIDNEVYLYENNDDVIIKAIVDELKDVVYYANRYSSDGTYEATEYLYPDDVETENLLLKSEPSYYDTLDLYWVDFINNNEFEIYENDELLEEAPTSEEKHDLKLIDKKGNTFVIKYDSISDNAKEGITYSQD